MNTCKAVLSVGQQELYSPRAHGSLHQAQIGIAMGQRCHTQDQWEESVWTSSEKTGQQLKFSQSVTVFMGASLVSSGRL
jgi:hypothetical protein